MRQIRFHAGDIVTAESLNEMIRSNERMLAEAVHLVDAAEIRQSQPDGLLPLAAAAMVAAATTQPCSRRSLIGLSLLKRLRLA